MNEPKSLDSMKLREKSSSLKDSYHTGFDAAVRRDRQRRKFTFGPNSQKVEKPNSILIDIYGVISPWSFVNKLKNFAKENIGQHVREHWNSKLVKNIVARIHEQINIDRQNEINIPEILPELTSNKEDIIESTIQCIRGILENKHKTLKPQIDSLCNDLWSYSYYNGKLKVDVYPDVPDALNYWRFEEFIKIYSYASGSVEGQRQFLKVTIFGDLNRFIANSLNSSGGFKFDTNKYKNLCAALRESRPENLLYITDDPKKAKSAKAGGIRVVVVNRTNSQTGKYDPKEIQDLIVVNSLSDIEFISNPTQPQIVECC